MLKITTSTRTHCISSAWSSSLLNILLCESPPPWFLQSSYRAPCGSCSCTFGRYFRTEGRKLCRTSPDSHLRMTPLLSKVKFITLASSINGFILSYITVYRKQIKLFFKPLICSSSTQLDERKRSESICTNHARYQKMTFKLKYL